VASHLTAIGLLWPACFALVQPPTSVPLSSMLSQVHIASPTTRSILHIDSSVLPAIRAHVNANGLGVSSATTATATTSSSVKSIEGPAFNGLVGSFTQAELSSLQSNFPNAIISISEDTQVRSLQSSFAVQTGPLADWGLARIAEYANTFPAGDYPYVLPGGNGVNAYVIDSGILTTHQEFITVIDSVTVNRAVSLVNYVTAEADTDLFGHGTFVAGVIGGNTYGVAKQVSLFSLKILDQTGNGLASDLVSALNAAVTDAKSKNMLDKSVINLSLGATQNSAIDAAVLAAYSAGVPVISAAGNNGVDACTTSPSGALGGLSVAATDETDTAATFSNFGVCARMSAPGVDITSSWIGSSNVETLTASGTSASAPFVSGTVALFLASKSYSAPYEVYWDLRYWANRGLITPAPSTTYTPNALLYQLAGFAPP